MARVSPFVLKYIRHRWQMRRSIRVIDRTGFLRIYKDGRLVTKLTKEQIDSVVRGTWWASVSSAKDTHRIFAVSPKGMTKVFQYCRCCEHNKKETLAAAKAWAKPRKR